MTKNMTFLKNCLFPTLKSSGRHNSVTTDLTLTYMALELGAWTVMTRCRHGRRAGGKSAIRPEQRHTEQRKNREEVAFMGENTTRRTLSNLFT